MLVCFLSLVGIALLFPYRATSSLDVGPRAALVEHAFPSSNQIRTLKAARSLSSVIPRGLRETCLHKTVELHYLDDTPAQSSPLAAKVHAQSTLPVLLLEEIESELSYVKCGPAQIEIGFQSPRSFEVTAHELQANMPFILITSVSSCDTDGVRDVKIVKEVIINEARRSLVLVASATSWRDAFQTFELGFGPSYGPAVVLGQNPLGKRQESGTASATTFSPTLSFPVPPSSSPTPEQDSTEKSIDFSFLDTAILPPDIPGVDSATLEAPGVPVGVSVKCKNCTVTGDLVLTEGSLTMGNASEAMTETEEVIDFFRHGYVKLVAKSFKAHIELETTVQPKALIGIQIPLPQIGIPGFTIPGVATVGPIFNPSIELSVELSAQLDFTYGFDLIVPDDSEIVIDIANVTNSSVTGFQDTTATALPFQAGIDDISLTFAAAFKPEVLLGISVLNGQGLAGAGVLLSLPYIEAKISQVANVDHLCNPLSTTNNNLLQTDNFTSLTNIVPKAVLDLELIAQAEVRAGSFRLDDAAAFTALSQEIPLPTACFSYDPEKKTFATAEPATEAAVETTKPGDVGKTSGATDARRQSVLLRGLKGLGLCWSTVVVLGVYHFVSVAM